MPSLLTPSGQIDVSAVKAEARRQVQGYPRNHLRHRLRAHLGLAKEAALIEARQFGMTPDERKLDDLNAALLVCAGTYRPASEYHAIAREIETVRARLQSREAA